MTVVDGHDGKILVVVLMKRFPTIPCGQHTHEVFDYCVTLDPLKIVVVTPKLNKTVVAGC